MSTQTVINTQTSMNTQTGISTSTLTETNIGTSTLTETNISTKVQVQSSVVLLTHPEVIPIINELAGSKLINITDLNDKKFWTGGDQVVKRTNFEYLILVFSVAVDIEKFSKAFLDTKYLYSIINITKPWPKKISKTTTDDKDDDKDKDKDNDKNNDKTQSATPVKKMKPVTPVRTQAPRTQAPRTQAPRTQAPRTQAPRTQAPRTPQPGFRPSQPRFRPSQPGFRPYQRSFNPPVPSVDDNINIAPKLTKIPVPNGENIIEIPRK